MKIGNLRCSDCGSDEVFSLRPGDAGAQTELFALTPSYPPKAWCYDCWARRFLPRPLT